MGKKQEISQFILTPILDLSLQVDGYGIRVSKEKLFEYLNQVDQEWYSIGVTEDSQRMLVIVEKYRDKEYFI